MLGGIPEHPHPGDTRLRIRGRRLPLGKGGQLQLPTAEPLGVRVGPRRPILDLLVLDEPTLLEVDQKHAPGLESPLGLDVLGRYVENADLAREDHPVVVGHPVPAGSQAIAVQNGPGPAAVGEEHRGGPVPRLHERSVVLVHGPAGGTHGLVVLPRLRDQHHDRFRHAPPGRDQQLEYVVQNPRIGGLGVHDREEPVELLAVEVALEEGLASSHPVHVPLERVDLAVVTEEAHRLRT